jgi:hypothetical protein
MGTEGWSDDRRNGRDRKNEGTRRKGATGGKIGALRRRKDFFNFFNLFSEKE